MTQHFTAAELSGMRASLARFTAHAARLTRLLERTALPRAAREETLRLASRALPWSPRAVVEREIRQIQERLDDRRSSEPFTPEQLHIALTRARAELLALTTMPVLLEPLPLLAAPPLREPVEVLR